MDQKTAAINVRVPQKVKNIVSSRASRAGVSESAFVRGAILRAATLPDAKFKEFINKYVLNPDLGGLYQHFEQEYQIQRSFFKTVEAITDMASGKDMSDREEDINQIVNFFQGVAKDIRLQQLSDKHDPGGFRSRFTGKEGNGSAGDESE
jgi:hypothetical protein